MPAAEAKKLMRTIEVDALPYFATLRIFNDNTGSTHGIILSIKPPIKAMTRSVRIFGDVISVFFYLLIPKIT